MTPDSFGGGDKTEGLIEDAQFTELVLFWRAVWDEGDFGATTMDTLEDLERRVTEAWYLDRDIGLAESLSAKALLLITGQFE